MVLSIQFTKMHGLHNDFVIIDNTKYKLRLTQQQIKFICNRKIGIGCDQLLLVEKHPDMTNQYYYTIFNQDGTNASHCGNGARCVIKYLYLNDATVNPNLPINLQTATRTVSGTGEAPYSVIAVTMGTALFEPDEVPFIHKKSIDNIYEITIDNQVIKFGVVNIGNPHVIIRLNARQQLDDREYLKRIASYLQNLPMFPDSINVNFYSQISRQQVYLITYERGVGFTEACGSGACATVAYMVKQNLTDNTVLVKMSGGNLNITLDKHQQVSMSGEAIIVFNGCFHL